MEWLVLYILIALVMSQVFAWFVRKDSAVTARAESLVLGAFLGAIWPLVMAFGAYLLLVVVMNHYGSLLWRRWH